ncbi:hypothetical protein [Spirosoma validum]|uniref:hypothetical protein n=1 Tax=Spirosoma validum TaxID=2771355 RepID=UPI001CC2F7FA|nr:hypothetical protein [Spirosoma validum]
MSKGTPQPTVRDTADETKKYELNTNLPDEAQGKTSRGKHKSKQSTEDEHDATGSVENTNEGGHGHSGHSSNRSGSESNSEKND